MSDIADIATDMIARLQEYISDMEDYNIAQGDALNCQRKRIAELEAEKDRLRELIKGMNTGYDDATIDDAMEEK